MHFSKKVQHFFKVSYEIERTLLRLHLVYHKVNEYLIKIILKDH